MNPSWVIGAYVAKASELGHKCFIEHEASLRAFCLSYVFLTYPSDLESKPVKLGHVSTNIRAWACSKLGVIFCPLKISSSGHHSERDYWHSLKILFGNRVHKLRDLRTTCQPLMGNCSSTKVRDYSRPFFIKIVQNMLLALPPRSWG